MIDQPGLHLAKQVGRGVCPRRKSTARSSRSSNAPAQIARVHCCSDEDRVNVAIQNTVRPASLPIAMSRNHLLNGRGLLRVTAITYLWSLNR